MSGSPVHFYILSIIKMLEETLSKVLCLELPFWPSVSRQVAISLLKQSRSSLYKVVYISYIFLQIFPLKTKCRLVSCCLKTNVKNILYISFSCQLLFDVMLWFVSRITFVGTLALNPVKNLSLVFVTERQADSVDMKRKWDKHLIFIPDLYIEQ